MITLDDLVQEVQDLAPLPTAAAKLVQILAVDEAEVGTAVEIIRFDQALTASVLRYANSPIAGAYYPTNSIKDATIRIGLGKVLEIAISSHVREPMGNALPEYGLGEEELWTHSVASALAAEVMLRDHKMAIPQLSFAAALLHDIGKLVLTRHLDPAIQGSIRRLTTDCSMTYYRAELEVLGFSHADLGAQISERWNLGKDISRAIGTHHEVETTPGPVADVVRISNLAAKTVGSGLGFEGMNLEADAGACERLGLDRSGFERLSADVAVLLRDIQKSHS